MSPLVRRALVMTLVVGALSVTLFATPAHAAGASVNQWQETTSWSVWTVFSLDYWMGFAGSLFGVDLSGDEAVADSSQAPTSAVFSRSTATFEPNGFYAAGTEPSTSEFLVDSGN